MKTAVYEIRIKGGMSDQLLAAFEGMESTVQSAETVLRGPAVDQAALHGLLDRVQALGLELIEVRRLSESPPAGGRLSPVARPSQRSSGPLRHDRVRGTSDARSIASTSTCAIWTEATATVADIAVRPLGASTSRRWRWRWDSSARPWPG